MQPKEMALGVEGSGSGKRSQSLEPYWESLEQAEAGRDLWEAKLFHSNITDCLRFWLHLCLAYFGGKIAKNTQQIHPKTLSVLMERETKHPSVLSSVLWRKSSSYGILQCLIWSQQRGGVVMEIFYSLRVWRGWDFHSQVLPLPFSLWNQAEEHYSVPVQPSLLVYFGIWMADWLVISP